MAIDPLGLTGKVITIDFPDIPEKDHATRIREDGEKFVSDEEKLAAVNEIFAAARDQKKRDAWNFVE